MTVIAEYSSLRPEESNGERNEYASPILWRTGGFAEEFARRASVKGRQSCEEIGNQQEKKKCDQECAVIEAGK